MVTMAMQDDAHGMDNGMGFIVEETSAELKTSDHSRSGRRGSRKIGENNMRRISEIDSTASHAMSLTASGLQDELTTSSARIKTSRAIGKSARSSDFEYTGHSGLLLGAGEANEPTFWQLTKQRIQNFRLWCGIVVNNERVQYAIVVCIFINALMMGLATYPFISGEVTSTTEVDITAQVNLTGVNMTTETPLTEIVDVSSMTMPTEPPLTAQVFKMADLFFLIIFTIELLLQFIYLGPKLLLDGWLVFDLIVIIPSWFSYAPNNNLNSIQIIRAFRIFRAFRLVTRVKIMKDLIVAILSVMPRMIAILMMLLLIFYIFAVMFTQLYSDEVLYDEELQEDVPVIYFMNLEQSMLTLFQLMTMDEWANIVRDLTLAGNKYCWIYLILFVVITGFIVVNLIVAVICDAISSLSDPDKARLQGMYDDDDDESAEEELDERLDQLEDLIGELTRLQGLTFDMVNMLARELQVENYKSGPSTNEASPETSARVCTSDINRPGLQKLNSSERSRRKGFAQTGYVPRRKSYTDTWTQEGSDKSLRRAMVSSFAKSARELQSLRQQEVTSNFAKSLRELTSLREEAAREEEEERRREEAKENEVKTAKMLNVLEKMRSVKKLVPETDSEEEKPKEDNEVNKEEQSQQEEAKTATMLDVLAKMKRPKALTLPSEEETKKKEEEEKKKQEEEEREKEENEKQEQKKEEKQTMLNVLEIMRNTKKASLPEPKKDDSEETKRKEEEEKKKQEQKKEEKQTMLSVLEIMQNTKKTSLPEPKKDDSENIEEDN